MEETSSPTILGVRVSPLSIAQVVDRIMAWTGEQSPHTAIGVNAHVCNQAVVDPRFRSLVNAADLTYADGQSIVWAARLLGMHIPQRVATTDLIYPLAQACAQAGRRMFLFGGLPGVAEAAGDRLVDRSPGLVLATCHGYVSQSEMGRVLRQIATFGTDILLVGLGDPAQQEWIARHSHKLTVGAVVTCGGLFDWVSGRNQRPPAWMVRAGLEWLWRVRLEPRRLARRYFVGNPKFIARLAIQMARSRSAGSPH